MTQIDANNNNLCIDLIEDKLITIRASERAPYEYDHLLETLNSNPTAPLCNGHDMENK